MRRGFGSALFALLTAGACLLQPTSVSAGATVGEAAPAVSLPGRGGVTVNLTDYRGHLVYLDFWASWCGPCRESFPWMNEMLQRYQARGLQIIAVNVDAKTADAESFLAKVPASFTIAYDAKGSSPEAYGLKGMPTSYLIGPDGEVLMVHQSFKDSDRADLESHIAAALQKVKP